jgi:hypothetical protein
MVKTGDIVLNTATNTYEYTNQYLNRQNTPSISTTDESAASETLGQMLASLHARVWRWRALALSHPKRSKRRSKESVGNLKSILAAIKERDADHAERITREEAHKAAEEVICLLVS